MIRRDRRNLTVPTSLTTVECSNHLTDIITLIRSGDPVRIKEGKDKISSKYYRGYHNSPSGEPEDVAVALRDLYDKKCAFCESKRFAPQVEHFRPKRRVTEGSVLGYYWLCYEWTNLLPVCGDCNLAKGNSFPILTGGTRVADPTFLTNGDLDTAHNKYDHQTLREERPKLLHPEYSNPQICFTFNSKGEISGIDNEGRGDETITTVNLRNPTLNYFRQKEIDHIRELSELALINNDDSVFEDVLAKLRTNAMDKNREYTLLLKIVYNEFDQIVIPLIQPSARARALTLYQAVRAEIDLTI
jgi:5-methylcytosine-specific restriction endonuclease McrA